MLLFEFRRRSVKMQKPLVNQDPGDETPDLVFLDNLKKYIELNLRMSGLNLTSVEQEDVLLLVLRRTLKDSIAAFNKYITQKG